FRAIQVRSATTHRVAAKLPAAAVLGEDTIEYLTYDLDYVDRTMPLENLPPRHFYRGMSRGWSAIEQNLDVRRRLSDQILYDVVLREESERVAVELVVVKAEAGAG